MTDLRRRRAAAQRLHRPDDAVATDPAALVRALLAVQAQDLRAARLALRARSAAVTAADVDAALTSGALTITWLLRGTLHLVATEDAGWLLALTAPTRTTTNARRLREEGVTPAGADRAVAIIDDALAAAPLSRAQLAERVAAAGIRTDGQAMPHLLMLAALRGVAVLGPVDPDGGAPLYVAGGPRLGRAPHLDRDAGLADLARRYCAAHAPAGAEDLAAWSGLPLRDARTGLAAVGEAATGPRPPRTIAPRLLGAFDPYMLGWKDRSFAVAPEHARRVHPGGGMLRPVAIADGRAVATWKRGRRAGAVELDPFEPLEAATERALRADGEDLARFEG